MRKNIILNYGFYLGLSTILTSVLKYTFGNYLEKSLVETFLGIILIVLFIYLGISTFKKNNSNFLSVKESLQIGLGISLIAALLSVFYIYVFSSFIEPNFQNEVIKLEMSKMNTSNLSRKDMEKSVSIMKNYMMPMMYFGIIIMNLFLGFITSLILGLALKKDKSVFN